MNFDKRWLPAVLTPTLIAAVVIAVPLQANAIDLPDLTPQQVMLLMENGKEVSGFSGTVTKTTNLGLPALELSSIMTKDMVERMEAEMPEGFEEFTPQVLEQSALTDALALIAGTHKVRVFASEEGFRAQILDLMGQRDIIATKDAITLYDFDSNTVSVIDLAGLASEFPEIPDADMLQAEQRLDEIIVKASAELQLDLSNPAAVAEYLLAKASETTTISVGKDHRTAGRTAYQLIATPKADYSLIDSIVVSVDSETGFVLDTKVYSVEQEEPALHVGFTNISFVTPDASLFQFSAPTGATVNTVNVKEELSRLEANIESEYSEELAELRVQAVALNKEDVTAELEARLNSLTEEEKTQLKQDAEVAISELAAKYLIGKDWETVVKLDGAAEQLPTELMENPIFADLMETIPGGKAFSTPLVNIAIMDSGDIYVGAVTLEHLISLTK
jgi:outer membrane lipoprotein-sorting protein